MNKRVYGAILRKAYESRSLSWQGREGQNGPAFEMRLDRNRSAHATV